MKSRRRGQSEGGIHRRVDGRWEARLILVGMMESVSEKVSSPKHARKLLRCSWTQRPNTTTASRFRTQGLRSQNFSSIGSQP
jgi:hypothetical protein